MQISSNKLYKTTVNVSHVTNTDIEACFERPQFFLAPRPIHLTTIEPVISDRTLAEGVVFVVRLAYYL